ncbi:MAG: cysteine desulfurase-like protein [Planctomycetes bacterium]|nr:cysteine desulfurase-like protein [Planctomycetota bacterium]
MRLLPSVVEACRRQFPALAREIGGRPAVFFDGPAGTQVPSRVIDAIAGYLRHTNANHGGTFATSRESDALLWETHAAAADLLGTKDPATVSFGPNMTTLTFALSRALARTWKAGDEIIVTQLDHDANYTPWVLAARDAGVRARVVPVRADDCTLDLDFLDRHLGPRTRLVAVGCASNSVGTINPVREICERARAVGALTFLDAVHFAPHAAIDVQALHCDFLVCSAYKFFGPHVGIQWGRKEILEELEAYKLRPAPDDLPGKWMTGTQSHECILGVRAAVEYLADLGRTVRQDGTLSRRRALVAAYQAIRDYETDLARQLLSGLRDMPHVRIRGIADLDRMHERVATVAVTLDARTSRDVADHLGRHGIFVWHGNYYALNLGEALGVEPDGMVRIGLVHYNTSEEVDRLLRTLGELV